MRDTRWQGFGLILAAGLVVPGFFMAGPVERRPGFQVTLAGTAPAGSSTTLFYHASVPSSDRIDRQDVFRIIDPPGLVAGSAAAPAGWTVTTESISPGPKPASSSTPDDDPALPNLVFTYQGAAPIVGPVLVKGFSARSTSGTPRAVRWFVGRSTRATDPGIGTKVVSAGAVGRPGAVPEPASLLTSCLGLIVLGIVYAHRHRRNHPVVV